MLIHNMKIFAFLDVIRVIFFKPIFHILSATRRQLTTAM